MAHMNSFEKLGLDDDAFGEKSGLAGLKTFDAFRKSPCTGPLSWKRSVTSLCPGCSLRGGLNWH